MPHPLEDQYVQLIQANEGIIHKVIALHIDDAEEKRDLFQEILLQAWKSYPKFSAKSKFSTWLYRVALNTVFTYKKKRLKTQSLDLAPEQAENPAHLEEHELLYRLIRQLDPVDRTLMSMHLDGYKNKEIAEIMGMSNNLINVKIHRLKNQIIESFKTIYHGHQ